MAEKKRWKKVEVKKLVSSRDEPEVLYRLPSGFPSMEIEVCESPFELDVRHVTKKKEVKVEIGKKTTVTYSMDAKEITEIVLKSLELREDLVDSVVFTTDSAGPTTNTLGMEIIVSFKDDPDDSVEVSQFMEEE